jgi:hypothetical protein
MLWLGEKRGYLIDWITQRWVCITGRQVSLSDTDWLQGLIGKTTKIGSDYFINVAQEAGFEIQRGDILAGLIRDFDALMWDNQSKTGIQPGVRHFYEQTAAYNLDVWSQWSGVFRPFGSLLAVLFSRRLQQLNVPLSGLDTSRGVTSEIIQLLAPSNKEVRYTAWVRELIGTGNTLYAGSYSVCTIPAYKGKVVKVVFPLPNGNAIVVMKPTIHEDGSFTLASSGAGFGDAGFYFTVHRPDGRSYVRYVRALRESIHVYETNSGDIRADHVLTLWGLTFLRLHYRLRLRESHNLILT